MSAKAAAGASRAGSRAPAAAALAETPAASASAARRRASSAARAASAARRAEATSLSDVSVQARLLDLIRHLAAELGLAVVIVTHDLAVARLLSHRMIVMQGGRVIETGLSDQVLDDPAEPYTQLLVSSVLAA